jgi:hypothetical protein
MEAGLWTGRQQAFDVIAGKCTAAKAAALKELRDSRAHEGLGLTWEQFCAQYAGISRSQADDVIRRYNELGADYFRLAEIARVSPETYQSIAPRVDNGSIELNGETIPLVPENTLKIRAGIRTLTHELRQALKNQTKFLGDLFHRVDRLTKDVYQYDKLRADEDVRWELVTLSRHAADQFRSLQKHLEAQCTPNPVEKLLR